MKKILLAVLLTAVPLLAYDVYAWKTRREEFTESKDVLKAIAERIDDGYDSFELRYSNSSKKWNLYSHKDVKP